MLESPRALARRRALMPKSLSSWFSADHELKKGEWEGSRECHIGGDFLLVYQDHGKLPIFGDLGSHSELFG